MSVSVANGRGLEMIKTKVYLRDIDYNTLVKLMMPYIERWLSEKDNIFYDLFTKIISKKGKPTKFSNLFVSFIPKKDELAAAILPHFDELILEYLNNILSKNNIIARIGTIKVDTIDRNQETLLRIVMDIEDINYEATIDYLLPLIIQRLSEKDDSSSRVGNLLMQMNELPSKALKAAMGAIALEERDNITAAVLTEYKVEIRDLMNLIILQNNIKAEISAIKIECIQDNSLPN